ncbi:ABC transporter permease subunit [Leisingera daeponensis]|uniref:ABC transporter permease subunit n=1 Tax=Leisingera daeponensis TaxID=405746 RepID=A0ABS7NIP1_9RHOB|nr:ABC transporter permease subunit [Leisingera daeponensis]MBY6141074.1 ABC transporter permease subunit [Leisingera daeponensis]
MTVPLTDWLGAFFAALAEFKAPFRALAAAAKFMMEAVRDVLAAIPWPVHVIAAVLAAHRASGRRLAVFAVLTYAYTLGTGKWDATLNTLALVIVAVPFALMVGFIMGTLAAKSDRARAIVEPFLDLMQTVPAFAYLVPAMLLLGFGPQVGLVVSVIYAAPPMARNVMLGLRRVPSEQIEASLMMGMTPRQRFFQVEMPASISQLAVGINQCVMATFAMVIIASVIGGFNDIGWEVSGNYRRQVLGASFEAGIVVTLFAILIDRTGNGFTRLALLSEAGKGKPGSTAHLKAGAILIIAALLLSVWVEAFRVFPETIRFGVAEMINALMDQVLHSFGPTLKAIKSKFVIFFMKPLEAGLVTAVTPMFWGFALTPPVIAGYFISASAAAVLFMRRGRTGAAIGILSIAVLVFFGMNGVPWPVWFIMAALAAERLAGRRTACFVVFTLAFILLNGLWDKAIFSMSLVTSAIFVSVAIGLPVGVLASMNRPFAIVVRSVNDFLQSVPVYVLLIPPLWLFRTSEFASMLAIVAYAIVPCIRYTYEGLLNTPDNTLEAARSMGMTRWQILLRVKIPMAVPAIMLGVNQTILFSLAMLVIAALITTRGLGQQIYTALGQQDPGLGIVAGLCIALIAMSMDRILQGWAAEKKQALGQE